MKGEREKGKGKGKKKEKRDKRRDTNQNSLSPLREGRGEGDIEARHSGPRSGIQSNKYVHKPLALQAVLKHPHCQMDHTLVICRHAQI